MYIYGDRYHVEYDLVMSHINEVCRKWKTIHVTQQNFCADKYLVCKPELCPSEYYMRASPLTYE